MYINHRRTSVWVASIRVISCGPWTYEPIEAGYSVLIFVKADVLVWYGPVDVLLVMSSTKGLIPVETRLEKSCYSIALTICYQTLFALKSKLFSIGILQQGSKAAQLLVK